MIEEAVDMAERRRKVRGVEGAAAVEQDTATDDSWKGEESPRGKRASRTVGRINYEGK